MALHRLSSRLSEQFRQRLLKNSDFSIHTYIQVTDGGSDQVSSKHIIGSEVLLCIFILHLCGLCLHHGTHIGVRNNVNAAGPVAKHKANMKPQRFDRCKKKHVCVKPLQTQLNEDLAD